MEHLVAHRVGGFEQQNLLKAEFSDATEPPASFDCKEAGSQGCKLKIKFLMNSAQLVVDDGNNVLTLPFARGTTYPDN